MTFPNLQLEISLLVFCVQWHYKRLCSLICINVDVINKLNSKFLFIWSNPLYLKSSGHKKDFCLVMRKLIAILLAIFTLWDVVQTQSLHLYKSNPSSPLNYLTFQELRILCVYISGVWRNCIIEVRNYVNLGLCILFIRYTNTWYYVNKYINN